MDWLHSCQGITGVGSALQTGPDSKLATYCPILTFIRELEAQSGVPSEQANVPVYASVG